MTLRLTFFLAVLCLVPILALGGTGGGEQRSGLAIQDTSAPDPWGYTWVRSTDPGGPTFSWVDISTIGTLVSGLGDDNTVGPFSIGFDFPYYWYNVNTFRIGSNGYITFGNQTANFASPFAAFPNTGPPNDMVGPLCGDLDFTITASNPRCYYWSNGVDSLVVSFINVTEWQQSANPNLKHTFQLILKKADSSIIFQYGEQQGQFNATNNTTLSIGIENSTGQIGLNYGFSSTPPHAFMPTNGLAVRVKRTVNTGLQVTDVGTVGGFNTENLGKIVQVNQADTIRCIVRNFGTVPLSNVRVTYAISRTGQPTARDTVNIASMALGEQLVITFPRTFTPTVTGSWSALFTSTVTGDQGPGNNSRTAELLAVNFQTTSNTRLAFDGGVSGGSINWLGGGGMAMNFEVPVAQVRIESVYVQVASITAAQMTVEILDGAAGVPGTLLGTRIVNAIVGNNGVSFVSDSIRITSRRFFVGARGQMAFSYEIAAPISFRSWEYTGGYAPYRSRDLQDVMIRAAVRLESTTSVGEPGEIPERIHLSQNYPNPFNPSTKIQYGLPGKAAMSLTIFDVLGREIRTLIANEVTEPGMHEVVWDGTNEQGLAMPSGTYFLRLTSGGFAETKKLLLLK